MKNNVPILLAAVCLTLLAIGCNTTPPNPKVVGDIQVPSNATILCTAQVDGIKHMAVQMYRCDSLPTGKYGWTPAGPDAELYNEKDEMIGHHSKNPAGPVWQLAKDGSKVIGAVDKKIDATAKGAVQWLLLKAIENEGADNFGKVKWIQRVNTEGGIAPPDTCTKYSLGKIVRVPYKATYYFYK